MCCSATTPDRDIHNTVLIAAAFCLFNRDADGGLATALPTDGDADYRQRAGHVAANGYVTDSPKTV